MERISIGQDFENYVDGYNIPRIGNDASVPCEYDGNFHSQHPQECNNNLIEWIADVIKKHDIKTFLGGSVFKDYYIGGHIHFGNLYDKIKNDIDRAFLDIVLMYVLSSVQNLDSIHYRQNTSDYGRLAIAQGYHRNRENKYSTKTFEYRGLCSPESVEMAGAYFGLASFAGRVLHNKINLQSSEATKIVTKITKLVPVSQQHFCDLKQNQIMRIASNVICRIKPHLESDEMKLVSPIFRLLKSKKTVKPENFVNNRIIKKLMCEESKKSEKSEIIQRFMWRNNLLGIDEPVLGSQLSQDSINVMSTILYNNHNLISTLEFIKRSLREAKKVWIMRDISISICPLVGFIVLKETNELGYFTICPDYRYQGLGCILLTKVIDSHEVDSCFLRCIAGSTTDKIMMRNYPITWTRTVQGNSKVFNGKDIVEYRKIA